MLPVTPKQKPSDDFIFDNGPADSMAETYGRIGCQEGPLRANSNGIESANVSHARSIQALSARAAPAPVTPCAPGKKRMLPVRDSATSLSLSYIPWIYSHH